MPYTDYSGFDQSYFEGAAVADPNPAGYTDYTQKYFDYSAIADRVGQNTQPIIAVGVAYGYTVTELRARGVEIVGMDISSWAVQQANSQYVLQGDARSSTDVATLAGEVTGNPKVAVSLCLLSCLTDDEAVSVCENLRAEAQSVAHLVWTDPNPDYYNKKTLADWQALCDPNGDDTWIDFNDPTADWFLDT